MRRWIRDHQSLIAFALFALAVFVSFAIQEVATSQRREQICRAELETRVVIRDIVDFAVPKGSDNPRIAAFRDRVYERTEIPPSICKGTGVNFNNLKGSKG